jgi:hypothetical protein
MAGFPSTAGRLAFRAVPSRRVAPFEPAPGIRWPRAGLLPSFVHPVIFPNVPLGVGSVRRKERPRMPGTPTTPDRPGTRDHVSRPSCLPSHEQRRHPGLSPFAAQWLAYALPLPALRPCSRELSRMKTGAPERDDHSCHAYSRTKLKPCATCAPPAGQTPLSG